MLDLPINNFRLSSPFGRRRGFSPADIFANDEDGWLLGAYFQDATATTPAAVTEVIGFRLDTHAGAGYSGGSFTGLGTEEVTNGGFDVDTTGWAGARGNETLTINSGSLRATADASGAFGASYAITGLTVGAAYLVSGDDAGFTSSLSSKRVGTNAALSSGLEISTSDMSGGLVFIATATTMYVGAIGSAGSAGQYLQLDNISVRELPGNHLTQSNTSFKPIRRANGAEYDGTDDRLVSTLSPTTAGTIIARFTGSAASRVIAGSQPASDGRCYLGLDANGKLAAGIGTQGTATIFGGSDIRDTETIGAVTWNGTTVKLYVDGTEVYSEAQSGAVNTTVAMYEGALNANGTAAAFWDGVADSRYVDRALTAQEITNLTNNWS